MSAARADLVLAGGRVLDPETGLDAVMDVAVSGRRIVSVEPPGSPADGATVIDVYGQVVAPGFIDLHSHGQGIPEQRLQAFDGVTTALELEGGAHPVGPAYAASAAAGRPINYGYSASWAVARMAAVAGFPPAGEPGLMAHLGDPAWQRAATPAEVDALLDLIDADLDGGAIGIGMLVGYAPGCETGEYQRVAARAAERGVPTWTHARDLVEVAGPGAVDGATEIVQAAAATGAHMHYCHINSTSGRHVDRVHDLVERVRAEGSAVTTEAYPYGAGMTAIGAAFLLPERLSERGLTPQSIRYAPTGERMADAGRLEQVRREDPGGLAVVEFFREDRPDEFRWVEHALGLPEVAVASDAMPIHWTGPTPDPLTWPLPAGGVSHPRSAGCFARALRLSRDGRLWDLPEAIRRCTLLPARILQPAVPAMRAKARVQAGCDADLVVFDPATVTDQATYEAPLRPSTGFRHVIVGGTFVVREGQLCPDALPGEALRAGT